MVKFIIRRILLALVSLFGVVTVVFFIVRVIPGDPASMMLGMDATPEMLQSLRSQLGLDKPVYEQYLVFLKDSLQGNFGTSLYIKRPSIDLVIERMPATAELALYSVMLSVLLAIPLGIISALKVNSSLDRFVSLLTLGFQSMPDFWIGTMLMLIFARTLNLLPTSGKGDASTYIMPVVTLSLPLISYLTRIIRSGLLDNLSREYVRTAHGKGQTKKNILWKHVFQNTLIPVVTILGLQMGALLGGVVVVETVFAWPGIGRLVVDGILKKDFPIVQAGVLAIAIAYIFINLIVDLTYAVIDPRIRLANKNS